MRAYWPAAPTVSPRISSVSWPPEAAQDAVVQTSLGTEKVHDLFA